MYRQATHAMVRSLIFKLCPSAVVVVLNGSEKVLSYYNEDGEEVTRPMPCSDDEVCNAVSRLVKEDKLSGRPLAFTGFVCVGMGQTLTCEETGPFTSAVFGPVELTNDDIYQLFGRTCGNMLNWKTYCTTTVYCPEKFMHISVGMERVARLMAEEHNGADTSIDTIYGIIDTGKNSQAIKENRRKNSAPSEPKAKALYSDIVFANLGLAKAWATANLNKNAATFMLHGADGGNGKTHFKYRGKLRAIDTLENTLKCSDNGANQGESGSPRVMPVYTDAENTIGWIVVYHPRFIKK
jgi:hypothetical protein